MCVIVCKIKFSREQNFWHNNLSTKEFFDQSNYCFDQNKFRRKKVFLEEKFLPKYLKK
jgi:hypothetical protein